MRKNFGVCVFAILFLARLAGAAHAELSPEEADSKHPVHPGEISEEEFVRQVNEVDCRLKLSSVATSLRDTEATLNTLNENAKAGFLARHAAMRKDGVRLTGIIDKLIGEGVIPDRLHLSINLGQPTYQSKEKFSVQISGDYVNISLYANQNASEEDLRNFFKGVKIPPVSAETKKEQAWAEQTKPLQCEIGGMRGVEGVATDNVEKIGQAQILQMFRMLARLKKEGYHPKDPRAKYLLVTYPDQKMRLWDDSPATTLVIPVGITTEKLKEFFTKN